MSKKHHNHDWELLVDFFSREEKSLGRRYGWAQHIMNTISIQNCKVLDAPLLVGLNIIEQCNQKCRFCSRKDKIKPQRKPVLQERHYRQLLSRMAEEQVMEVYLTGGEPFLRPGLVLFMLKQLSKTRIAFKVLTNGTLLTRNYLSKLAKVMPKNRSYLQFSLDAPGKELYKYITGTDLFDLVIENISDARKKDIGVKIKMVVSNLNFHCMAEMYRLAIDLGVDFISFSPVFLCNANPDVKLNPDDELAVEWSKVIQINKQASGNPPRIQQHPFAVSCGLPIFTPGNEVMSPYPPPDFDCPMSTISCEIDPYGNVIPCPYLETDEWFAGNILEEDFIKIWKIGRNWRELRARHFQPTEMLAGALCSQCPNLLRCRGACISQAYELKHSVRFGDPRCMRYREVEKKSQHSTCN